MISRALSERKWKSDGEDLMRLMSCTQIAEDFSASKLRKKIHTEVTKSENEAVIHSKSSILSQHSSSFHLISTGMTLLPTTSYTNPNLHGRRITSSGLHKRSPQTNHPSLSLPIHRKASLATVQELMISPMHHRTCPRPPRPGRQPPYPSSAP